MMRQILFLTCSVVLLLQACKPEGNTPGTAMPSGRYINMTVLKGCPDKMPSDIPSLCFEINFNGKDSATLDNGFETFTLAVVPADHPGEFKLVKASLYGDMLLTVTSDSTLALTDTAWTRQTGASAFEKIARGERANWTFREFLNDCLISGSGYALFKEGNLVPGEITFMANGEIKGMAPYVRYAWCYAGDCLEETDPPSHTLDLLDAQGNRETFSVKAVGGKMAFELYKLGDPIPDQKGGRAIGPMVYELRTE